MSERTEKIEITAHLKELQGSGEDLVWVISGHRRMKTGEYINYELRLKTCRYGAHQVLEQLKAMHKRDRERIRGELATIETERTILTTE